MTTFKLDLSPMSREALRKTLENLQAGDSLAVSYYDPTEDEVLTVMGTVQERGQAGGPVLTLENLTSLSEVPFQPVEGSVWLVDPAGCPVPTLVRVTPPEEATRKSTEIGTAVVTELCWCGSSISGDACTASRLHNPRDNGRPEKVEKLYLAGPMSGYPEANYPVFNATAARLRTAGYEVVNPAEIHLERQHHYVDLLREDLVAMFECHAVAVLDLWWESVGARNEVQVAGILKMPVRSWRDWINDKLPPKKYPVTGYGGAGGASNDATWTAGGLVGGSR